MKRPRKSRTLWYNWGWAAALATIEGAALAFQLSLPPAVYIGISASVIAGNIFLRYKTREAIR